MSTVLAYHPYKYYPYEKALAARELSTLSGLQVDETPAEQVWLSGSPDLHRLQRLAYFASVTSAGREIDTLQSRLENAGGPKGKRQSTRYSVHGLHEYKGKFNPQIVKAILNIFGVDDGCRVLDPFCGSGTTLVEASQIGATATGYDINPFAVFLANAKLQALQTSPKSLDDDLDRILAYMDRFAPSLADRSTERMEYLGKWFTPDILDRLEQLREAILTEAPDSAPVFLCVASNLLRDYSLQDPNDLRIRRRKSPLPERDLLEPFEDGCRSLASKIQITHSILGRDLGAGKARLRDIGSPLDKEEMFDAAITSPPYAMALPYIDTQRLSLVWLGLTDPRNILPLEASLIGSREAKLGELKTLEEAIRDNAAGLPADQLALCRQAKALLSATDGFRRKAVPGLLYRYFSFMRESFRSVFNELKPGAPYALVVGHNHTTLGGQRIDIDTPSHLAALAESVGWNLVDIIPLQTYQRYGYHAENAVAAESLILLGRP